MDDTSHNALVAKGHEQSESTFDIVTALLRKHYRLDKERNAFRHAAAPAKDKDGDVQMLAMYVQ